MRIAFDTWPLLCRFRKSGIHVYSRNLLAHFREIASSDSVEIRPLVCPGLANDANAFSTSTRYWPHESRLLRIGKIWRYGGACISARASKSDLLFCPSASTLPIRATVPVVTTIHDVMPVIFPEFPRSRSLRFGLAKSAKWSRAIITVSAFSKQALLDVFGVPEEKVQVVHSGCDDSVFNDELPDPLLQRAVIGKLGVSRPFIFHHGRLHPHKNLKRLIQAYDRLLSRNRNLDADLVLVGDFSWQHEEVLKAAAACNGRTRVIMPGPLSDLELAILLKSASLVVIPSLYEGFCLPLLEAMACGAPVICANSSCLPEVSGNQLLYFDPYSVEDMAVCMEKPLEDAELRWILARNGKTRAHDFSWQRCAEKTLAILKAAASN